MPEAWDVHRRNVVKTIGVDHEYLRIDNTRSAYGICRAYNGAIEYARGDVLVFVHEDVFLLSPDWGAKLEAKFSADPSLGLIGLAGTQYLLREPKPWVAAGRPFIRGRVVHECQGSQVLSVYSHDQEDAEVVVADGLFLAMRKEVFRYLRFDEVHFDHFHFYDLDVCMPSASEVAADRHQRHPGKTRLPGRL
jgi:glycosyltransferase involved in cell wall biosynthesis